MIDSLQRRQVLRIRPATTTIRDDDDYQDPIQSQRTSNGSPNAVLSNEHHLSKPGSWTTPRTSPSPSLSSTNGGRCCWSSSSSSRRRSFGSSSCSPSSATATSSSMFSFGSTKATTITQNKIVNASLIVFILIVAFQSITNNMDAYYFDNVLSYRNSNIGGSRGRHARYDAYFRLASMARRIQSTQTPPSVVFDTITTTASPSSFRGRIPVIKPPKMLIRSQRSKDPQYGDWNFHSKTADQTGDNGDDDDDRRPAPKRRVIGPNDDAIYARERKHLLKYLEETITSEDIDTDDLDRYEHWDEQSPDGDDNDCYHLEWKHFPDRNFIAERQTCNELHSIRLLGGFVGDANVDVESSGNGGGDTADQYRDEFKLDFLGYGSYRETWMFTDTRTNEPEAVIKTRRWRESLAFKNYAYDQTKAEVLSMLVTHSSDRTMNVYQYCGTSTIVEPGEEIEDPIIPWYGWKYVSEEDLEDKQKIKGNIAMNRLSANQKLLLAILLAESIALLHGNEDGPIVSHDITFGQWLRSKKDGKIKLNDFNKARILKWNYKKQEYCRFYSSQYSSYRDPVEIHGGFIDESADVIALGKFFYTIVTGLRAYYHKSNKKGALKAALRGEYPYIDPRFRGNNRNFIEGRMVEIMEKMWTKNITTNRPDVDIFEVVRFLHETKDMAGAAVTSDKD